MGTRLAGAIGVRLVLVATTALPALADASVTTQANATMSSSTAGSGGSGAYTTLTGAYGWIDAAAVGPSGPPSP